MKALKDYIEFQKFTNMSDIEKDTTLASKNGNRLIICTRLPGWYIGKDGELYEKYFQMIKNGKTDKGERILLSPFVVEKLEKIEFVETFCKI